MFAFTRYQEENNMSTNVLPDPGYICQMYYDDHGRYPNYNDLFSGDKSLFGGNNIKEKEFITNKVIIIMAVIAVIKFINLFTWR
jgi:hypothetical protein